MKDIPESYKVVFVSAGPLVAVIILFFLVGNFGISKIQDIRTQIDEANISQNVLSQKVNLLQTVSSTLANSSNAAAIALPDANTSLAAISQVKFLAVTNGIAISNIKGGIGAKDATGLSKVSIGFDLDGGRDQIVAFLNGLPTIAPLVTLQSVKFSSQGGATKASVTLQSYWADLPTTLPATNQALNDLTADEKTILANIASLVQPSFSTVQPGGASGRTNPFAQ